MTTKDSILLNKMDEIVQKTLDSLEEGKREIFEIAEEARRTCTELENQLNQLKEKIDATIREVDYLERLEKGSRQRLMNISRDFKNYNEEDIRKAYETAKELQVQVIVQRERENELIAQRSDYERKLKRARSTLERAEFITGNVASAMSYLKMALTDIDDTILEVRKKEELGIRVILAQEEERQRVARDIHDGPAQSLSNLVIKTELCERFLDIDLARAREEIRNLKALVRGSLHEIRKIIFDLRPMSLDDLGLVAAIRQYVARFMDETGIDVVLEVYPEEINLDSPVEVAIFRIIQEALNNIIKHAEASQVFINLKVIGDFFIGSIIDNGVGFDMERLSLNKSKGVDSGGLGIYGMKERAELLKGRLSLNSQVGKGTTLRVEFPLNPLEKKGGNKDDKSNDS